MNFNTDKNVNFLFYYSIYLMYSAINIHQLHFDQMYMERKNQNCNLIANILI